MTAIRTAGLNHVSSGSAKPYPGGVEEGARAPWSVAGECILAWARRPRPRPALPAGLHRLPGPVAIVGVRYTDSPVGPYLAFSVAEPARLGLRPGLCMTTMAVTAAQALTAHQVNGGLPPCVAALGWAADGDERELIWEERGIVVRGRPVRTRFPFLVPVRSLQRRNDALMLAPRVFYAMTRPARVEITTPDDDELAWAAGSHAGAVMAGMRVLTRPARTPTGLLSSLRAPGWAPEPAGMGRAPSPRPKPVQWRPSRALSSVG